MYNYLEEMKSNIHDVLNWNKYDEEITNDETALYDALWCDDYITGNGSGSYTFNREQAKAYVLDNTGLLKEMADEFGFEHEEIADKIIDEEWEWLDVSIRCYLLGEAVAEVIAEREEA